MEIKSLSIRLLVRFTRPVWQEKRMNGYIVISLENGLMLFTHTHNNYGLSESKEPLEISSYLYAVYTLSQSFYENDPTEGGRSYDQSRFGSHGIMNEAVVASFKESPITYFQQDGIFWHFYEICGKDSDLLTIISSNCQIDHQYVLLFAAKLSQTFLTTTISECVSPRSGIGKKVRNDYKELLEIRVKEIIYYLFENLFIASSSIGLVYVPEECSSMINAYQLLERGKYTVDPNSFSMFQTISENWICPNPIPQKIEEAVVTTESNHPSPPQRYLSSVSETNLTVSHPNNSTDQRPYTAGDALRSSESTTIEEESTDGFLKSPFQWVKKKLTFKSKKLKDESSSSNKLNSQEESHKEKDKHTHDTHTVTELGPNQKNTSWQLFHLDEELAKSRRDYGCPDMFSESSIPWLFQLIETYQEHNLHLSNEDRLASLTTSLPPFILSTSIPSPQTEIDPAMDQYIHILDLSNSLYSTLSSRNMNVYLIWNESGTLYSDPPPPPSDGNITSQEGENAMSSKDKIVEIFQTTNELKLLFLEFLEMNLYLQT